jgi:transposase
MPREKRHYRRSRIPESKFCELVRFFAQDLSATDVAHLIGLTRKSVTNIFLKLRQRIAEDCEYQLAAFDTRHSHDEALPEYGP